MLANVQPRTRAVMLYLSIRSAAQPAAGMGGSSKIAESAGLESLVLFGYVDAERMLSTTELS